MNQDAEGNSLNELAALRQRLEELEAEHHNLQRQVSLRRFFSRKVTLSAFVGTLLMVTVAILWGQEVISIFVDSNGNVGIGTNGPTAKLDVNGSARFSKIGVNRAPQSDNTVIITANGTDVPLNVTNPANTVNWLTVLKDGRVLMKGGNAGTGTDSAKLQVSGSTLLSNGTGESWFPYTDGDSYVSGTNVIFRSNGNTEQMRITKDGYVGIGKNNPGVPLDVKGEIRGKPWTSREYEWNNKGGSTQMTKADRSVCFLTYVKGSGQVSVGIAQVQDRWTLAGPAEYQATARARCIGAPDDSW